MFRAIILFGGFTWEVSHFGGCACNWGSLWTFHPSCLHLWRSNVPTSSAVQVNRVKTTKKHLQLFTAFCHYFCCDLKLIAIPSSQLNNKKKILFSDWRTGKKEVPCPSGQEEMVVSSAFQSERWFFQNQQKDSGRFQTANLSQLVQKDTVSRFRARGLSHKLC